MKRPILDPEFMIGGFKLVSRERGTNKNPPLFSSKKIQSLHSNFDGFDMITDGIRVFWCYMMGYTTQGNTAHQPHYRRSTRSITACSTAKQCLHNGVRGYTTSVQNTHTSDTRKAGMETHLE